MTEHLRVSGIFWGLTALDVMGELDRMSKDEVLDFITKCQNSCGGISPSINHDPHLLHTLSAVQVLCTYDALDVIDVEKVVKWVQERQQPDGSFTGDIWGEVDTRFSFCAVATLSLLVSSRIAKCDFRISRFWVFTAMRLSELFFWSCSNFYKERWSMIIWPTGSSGCHRRWQSRWLCSQLHEFRWRIWF